MDAQFPLFSGYTTGLPDLIYNKWTWTKIANMIFC